jgi:hypothetical protein
LWCVPQRGGWWPPPVGAGGPRHSEARTGSARASFDNLVTDMVQADKVLLFIAECKATVVQNEAKFPCLFNPTCAQSFEGAHSSED